MKDIQSHYFQTSDKINIHYNTNFKTHEFDPYKPLLVFNYGLVCNPSHFFGQYPFFEEKGFQLLVHNYRGHFNSSGSHDIPSITFSNMAKDLSELLSSLQAKNVAMISHSMGVNVGLEFSKLYPEQLKASILISGTILPPQDVMFDSNIIDLITPSIEYLSEKFPHHFEKIWRTNYLNPISINILHKGGFNTKFVSKEFVKIYAKRISEIPSKIFLHLLREMKNHDIINFLENIHTPSLIIGGDQDKVIPYYLQLVLKEYLPNSELYTLKNGSHVPQVDCPELINERIYLFLKQNMVI